MIEHKDDDVRRLARIQVRNALDEHDLKDNDKLVEELTELVSNFEVWTDTKFWTISEDDEHSPEEISDALVMRVSAELIKQGKALCSYPKLSYKHNPETGKLENVKVDYKFRPVFSEERSG